MQKSLFKNAFYKIALNFFNLIVPVIIGAYVYRTLGSHAIGSIKYGETIFNYFLFLRPLAFINTDCVRSVE